MAEPVTLENRQRGMDNAIRSDDIRPRVRKALEELGEGRTPNVDARYEFIDRAIRHAKNIGLERLWRCNHNPMREEAMKSLQTLLGEKKSFVRGRMYTGVNQGWILDIWESCLEYYFEANLFGDVLSKLDPPDTAVDSVTRESLEPDEQIAYAWIVYTRPEVWSAGPFVTFEEDIIKGLDRDLYPQVLKVQVIEEVPK